MSCSISIFNLFYYNMVDVKKWYQVSKSSISSRQMQNSLGGGRGVLGSFCVVSIFQLEDVFC